MRLSRTFAPGKLLFALGLVAVVAAPIGISAAHVTPVLAGSLCTSPPANFDPLRAPDSEIQLYGFPARPRGNRADIAQWATSIRGSTHRVCGNEVASHRPISRSPHQLRRVSATLYYYSNWSGYLVQDLANKVWDKAAANWYVPCYASQPSQATAVSWVGIGGMSGANPQELWQGGTEEDPNQGYRMWWEDWPNEGVQYAGPAVSCNSYVYVYVDFNYTVSNWSYVYLKNVSTGQYYSVSRSFAPDEHSAEFIDERLDCGWPWGVSALANFHQTHWTSAAAANRTYYNNALTGLSGWSNPSEIDMSDSSTLYATPYGSLIGNAFYD